ncbi:hypothetical protein [Streptomyces sp. NBC_01431]|uniref:hypothetical protein n=1 Tax=Streptomyces sp. NBC_01431 TaxID=2903863 RepID=UPI002E2FD1B9|nr:hypothetical protein [Streptomyces sp. NBC_01431]
MSSPVTVSALARAKGLDPQVLAGYAVHDVPQGVRIPYASPDGVPRRARLRTALRGADGSIWEDSGAPLGAYWHPSVPALLRGRPKMLLVEGESDCWTAWSQGVAALGVPGGDAWDTIGPGHLAGAAEIHVVVEPGDDPRTYPRGVHAYVAGVVERLRAIGHRGEIRRLQPPQGLDDINALYRADPASFTARVGALMAGSRPAVENG